MVRRKINLRQFDNRGFSLLEVLIGIIILTIVCVPLLRAFGTSAQTNARAKKQMKATTAAENIMEMVKTMTDDELLAKVEEYSDSGNENDASIDANNKIYMKIVDNDEIDGDMPEGYYAEVTLEPNGSDGYPNANGLNLADFNPISVRDCAIYTMSNDFDDIAYEAYIQKFDAYCTKYPSSHKTIENPYEYFKKNLTRTITISIEDTPVKYTDEDGEEHLTYRVHLKIDYELESYNTVVESSDRKYTATDAYLFDNTTSKKELNGIYLFYYPRYEASMNGSGKEKIIVENTHNVETELYITAMNGAPNESLRASYIAGKHLMIDVTENSESDAEKGFLTLRTNLLKTSSSTTLRTPYSNKDTNADYGYGANIRYKGKGGIVTDEAKVTKLLTISDVDGKTLDTSDTPIRIYKLRVSIKDSDDNQIAEMDGTKLKQY